jgi:hypothetical protein
MKTLLKFCSAILVLTAISCSLEPATTQQPEDSFASKSISGDIFDENDRFATETTNASGFGKVSETQNGGTIEVQLIQAKGLIPNHEYQLQAVVFFGSETEVYTSKPIFSNSSGHWKITNFKLRDDFDTGTYEVHSFVTHCHTTVAGAPGVGEFLTSIFNRDPLLSCEPAINVTVIK